MPMSMPISILEGLPDFWCRIVSKTVLSRTPKIDPNKTYQEMAAHYLIPKEWVIDYLLSTHYAKYRQKLKVHV